MQVESRKRKHTDTLTNRNKRLKLSNIVKANYSKKRKLQESEVNMPSNSD